MMDWVCWKPLSAGWPLFPPFPAISDFVFCVLPQMNQNSHLSLRKTYFDDTNLNARFTLQKNWCDNGKNICWLMVLLTWPAAKLARSLKATPTGNCINPELGWSNSLLSLFKALPNFSADHLSCPGREEQEWEASGPTETSHPCAP